MKDYRVTCTTPLAGFQAWVIVALIMAVTAYYRVMLFFMLATLYLVYLLWSYYWTTRSCRYVTGEMKGQSENVFVEETISKGLKFNNGWLFPVVRCGISFILPKFFAVAQEVSYSGKKADDFEEMNTGGRVFCSWQDYFVHYAWLKEKKEIELPLTIKPQLRGIYYIPPVQLFVGDPSGLFHGAKDLVKGHYLYVYPKPHNGEEVQKSLALAENLLETGYGLEDRYDVQGVRAYQVTDPPKSINWYATARTGSLKSNIYVRKNSLSCLIVFDTGVYRQPLYEPNTMRVKDTELEEAISFAAGLALLQLEQGAKTAFFTNSPRLEWVDNGELKKGQLPYQKRVRQITTMDFGEGDQQGQHILNICASIDDTGRATREEQEKLWARVTEVSVNSLVYVLTYHDPPAYWEPFIDKEEVRNVPADPHSFYTPDRISGLTAAGVKIINLTKGAAK